MKLSNESKVGIFTIAALAMLFLGFNFLKGNKLFNTPKYYSAYYSNIQGLVESNPVLINGYKVGKVEKIEMLDRNYKSIKIVFSVKKEIHIPVNSRARIMSSDLLGAKAIKIIISNEKKYLNNNDTLIGETEISLVENVSNMLSPIQEKFSNLLGSLDNIMSDLQSFLNQGGGKRDLQVTIDNLKATFQNVEHATAGLDKLITTESTKLHSIFTNVDNISNTLAVNSEKITNILTNINNVTDSIKAVELSKTLKKAVIAIDNINKIFDKINKGKGSLGMLVNNDTIYDQITTAAANFNKLILDFNNDPQRFINLSLISIRGSKNTKSEKKGK